MRELTLYVFGVDAARSLLRSPCWTDLQRLLAEETIDATWSPQDRGWILGTDLIGDVIALAEQHGWTVTMKGAAR